MFIKKKRHEERLQELEKLLKEEGIEREKEHIKLLLHKLSSILGRAEVYKLLTQAFGDPEGLGMRIPMEPIANGLRTISSLDPTWVELLPPVKNPEEKAPEPLKQAGGFKKSCPACGQGMVLDESTSLAKCPDCGHKIKIWWRIQVDCNDPFEISEWGNPGQKEDFPTLQEAISCGEKWDSSPCSCCGGSCGKSYITWGTGPTYKLF